jgi:hypothetical protein
MKPELRIEILAKHIAHLRSGDKYVCGVQAHYTYVPAFDSV